MQEMEAGQPPEWRDISDRGPIYKSDWAQWKPLAVRGDVLERHWESVDEKTAQIVIPFSKVKEVLAEMHGGTSRGHLWANRAIDKLRQLYYWLHLRDDFEVSTMWHLCRQPRSQNQQSWPDAPIRWRTHWEDWNWHRWSFPRKWQGKQVSPDRHGRIHEVTRCLHHLQSRGMDSGRRSGDLLLLPLRRPNEAAQRPGPEHQTQANAWSPGATRSHKTRISLHLQSHGKV